MKMQKIAHNFKASPKFLKNSLKNSLNWLAPLSCSTFMSTHSIAQELAGSEPTFLGVPLRTFEITQFALLAGSMIAALASALWLIRERGRVTAQNTILRAKVSGLTSRVNQLETLASAEGQISIIWSNGEAKPTVSGQLEQGAGIPTVRGQVLAFGRWLEPNSALRVAHAIDALRQNAIPFADIVTTLKGTPIEIAGRTSGGAAVIRLSNLSHERAAHAKLVNAHERIVNTLETLQVLMDKIEMPIWLRSRDGNLTWVNANFAKAVECKDGADVIERRAELFGGQALRQIAEQCQTQSGFLSPLTTVVGGDRLVFDVIEVSGPSGSAGLGFDRTETESVRHELNKTIRSHEETLDELTTAVAMFDEDQKLQFHNQSFAKLWNLEAAFLDQAPNISMFLDRLRMDRQLPEQPEWRRWKDDLLSAFRATEPQEHWWHLTDGRTVRVVANPLPKGGLTWVFENLTERIDLESRYKTMVQVQGETLDHLAEGVAVFGSDGRLQLANPAFEKFWALNLAQGDGLMHISDIAQTIKARGQDSGPWEDFAGTVTAFDEDRTSGAGKLVSNDKTLSWMIVPLPNGQTMITFVDVSASEQMERALRDRNEALERTALLRNRFIQHVSYELRSPLTTIMGFTDLISMEQIGPLNQKQREYIGHIEMSSQALLATTDNILDLASVDAGVLELNFSPVDIEAAMREAAGNLSERFAEHNIDLTVRIEPKCGTLIADRVRLIQIMENVLANAADFAPVNSTVTFSGERTENAVVFKVRDRGQGIDPEVLNEVFERFHAQAGGRRRGAGLGLAIVKSFVDLHHGHVKIESSPSRGTEVIITFPVVPSHVSVAAE